MQHCKPNQGPVPVLPVPVRAKGIQSLEIGLGLVRALVNAPAPQPLKLVAQAAGMSPSKARMYLVSLLRTGLVAQSTETGLYELGPFAAELGAVALQRTDLLLSAQQAMDRLGRATGTLMLLAGWGHSGATLLRQAGGAEVLPIDFRIGGHVSLTRTATGHVFLAHLPARATAAQRTTELAENQADPELSALDATYLDGVVAAVRANGTATVRNVRIGSGLVLVGYTAVAAPILGRDGSLRLVLTALLPKRRAAAGLAACRALLRQETMRLSELEDARPRAGAGAPGCGGTMGGGGG